MSELNRSPPNNYNTVLDDLYSAFDDYLPLMGELIYKQFLTDFEKKIDNYLEKFE